MSSSLVVGSKPPPLNPYLGRPVPDKVIRPTPLSTTETFATGPDLQYSSYDITPQSFPKSDFLTAQQITYAPQKETLSIPSQETPEKSRLSTPEITLLVSLFVLFLVGLSLLITVIVLVFREDTPDPSDPPEPDPPTDPESDDEDEPESTWSEDPPPPVYSDSNGTAFYGLDNVDNTSFLSRDKVTSSQFSSAELVYTLVYSHAENSYHVFVSKKDLSDSVFQYALAAGSYRFYFTLTGRLVALQMDTFSGEASFRVMNPYAHAYVVMDEDGNVISDGRTGDGGKDIGDAILFSKDRMIHFHVTVPPDIVHADLYVEDERGTVILTPDENKLCTRQVSTFYHALYNGHLLYVVDLSVGRLIGTVSSGYVGRLTVFNRGFFLFEKEITTAESMPALEIVNNEQEKTGYLTSALYSFGTPLDLPEEEDIDGETVYSMQLSGQMKHYHEDGSVTWIPEQLSTERQLFGPAYLDVSSALNTVDLFLYTYTAF